MFASWRWAECSKREHEFPNYKGNADKLDFVKMEDATSLEDINKKMKGHIMYYMTGAHSTGTSIQNT